jgi:cytochrome c biogenesis protein CcmG, thiol:disulfide interchange protein DsbE
MVKPLAVIPPLAFAALAGFFAWGMIRNDGDELPSALIGQTAPGVPETALAPLPAFDAAVIADGQVKLVNFWASWCAPCRVEHPHLTALAAEGVAVYGINYKDDPANALAFLDELGNPYLAALADPDGRHALDWGVYGVPETFVIAGDGTIVARMAGPVTERTLNDRLRPALAAAAGME